MPRVNSKNLFNFHLEGIVAEDVAAHEAKLMAEWQAAPKKSEFLKKMNEDNSSGEVDEFLLKMRAVVSSDVSKESFNHPFFEQSSDKTTNTEFKVPTFHDGDFDVPVFVYTPKELEGSANNAAYIYAHGGGVVCSSAGDSRPYLQYLAVDCNVVVFNVEYRLAPETKCPNNVKDFYETVKYICANARTLGVDPNKICIAGDSGGGYICLGTMVLLAQHDESSLIKLAIPGIPMVDDYCFTDPANMTVDERSRVIPMRKVYKYIAVDLEVQRSDPLMFPGKASEELLAKFPPTVIREVEFDYYITEATRLAARLRRAGRLLELVVIPGAKHGRCFMPFLQCFNVCAEVMKTIVKEYLHTDTSNEN